jgi:Transcription elongation factor, GreA/GreB, C-term
MKNNHSLRQVIITALERDLDAAAKAAESARQTATHKESVAENKYDTFGLEASYLAHGLSMRAEQSQQAIALYTSLPFKEFCNNDPIALTALVTLLTESDDEKMFFIGPEGGGLTFTWQGKNVMVITAKTPLGRQLIGKRVDDTVEIIVADKPVTYEILKIES